MNLVASRLILLAIYQEEVAAELRTLDTDEARLHAEELLAAAVVVREWARECDK